MFAISFAALSLFAIGRFAAYLFKGEKALPPRPRSRMAKVGYGGLICSCAVFALAIAENFSAKEGLLVSSVGPLQDVQAKLIGTPANEGNEPSTTSEQQDGEAGEDSSRASEKGLFAGIVGSLIGAAETQSATNVNSSGTSRSQTGNSSDAVLAALEPKPVTSWMQDNERPTGATTNASVKKMPQPGGTYSARLTSIDQTVSVASVADSGTSQSSKLLDSANEFEAAIGLDGRATANKLTAQSDNETVPTPGGTFSERLIVPLGAKVHGSFSEIQPGGSF